MNSVVPRVPVFILVMTAFLTFTVAVKVSAADGACWLFATVAAIEAAASISSGLTVSGSEQQVLDCRPGGSSCLGGSPDDALAYVAKLTTDGKGGLATEKEYPYHAQTGNARCTNGAGRVYNDPTCYKNRLVDHTVLVVGYVLNAVTPYWIIRNSWGTGWGDMGYMNLAIVGGPGICGITDTPGSYPVMKSRALVRV
eukprot:jgi/Mesen1/1246/ME000129S00343